METQSMCLVDTVIFVHFIVTMIPLLGPILIQSSLGSATLYSIVWFFVFPSLMG
jgi:hypothetical protein